MVGRTNFQSRRFRNIFFHTHLFLRYVLVINIITSFCKTFTWCIFLPHSLRREPVTNSCSSSATNPCNWKCSKTTIWTTQPSHLSLNSSLSIFKNIKPWDKWLSVTSQLSFPLVHWKKIWLAIDSLNFHVRACAHLCNLKTICVGSGYSDPSSTQNRLWCFCLLTSF